MGDPREPGYRDTGEADDADPEAPLGEIQEPTEADKSALARLRNRERANVIGILVMASFLLRMMPRLVRDTPAQGGLMLAGLALLLYAGFRYLRPPGFGPLIVRMSPDGEITAGRRLNVTVLMQPWRSLPLDPLLVRLAARRGAEKDAEVLYETAHRVADGHTVGAGEAVRFDAMITVPADAPPTSSEPRVRWRLEVIAGTAPLRSLGIRVREGARKARRK